MREEINNLYFRIPIKVKWIVFICILMMYPIVFIGYIGYKNYEEVITNHFVEAAQSDIELILENNKVLITSPKNIDLQDSELNEFLCSYKKTLSDDLLDIRICENVGQYNY